ncbi:hypothetical protein, partial [Pseudoflavonifractor sp. An85]|uniref:hypothetical protein n=1 Tax=Pseudoflavonifractor sp. An85 TaxID=1965661 RepID=UPI0019520EF5
LRIKESFSILYHYIPELASHSCLNWRKDPDQPFGTNGWSGSLRLFSRTRKKKPQKMEKFCGWRDKSRDTHNKIFILSLMDKAQPIEFPGMFRP